MSSAADSSADKVRVHRAVLESLARATAELGAMVLVPDWRSDAPDGGRAQLLGSASFTRQQIPRFGGNADAIVLAGWSSGGSSPAEDLRQARVTPVPFWLVHGTSDPVVSPAESQRFATLLAEQGWPVQLEELRTDHAGVVMAEYDPELARCRPARDRQAIAAGRRVAQILQAAAAGAATRARATRAG